jgi:hypothetical protein
VYSTSLIPGAALAAHGLRALALERHPLPRPLPEFAMYTTMPLGLLVLVARIHTSASTPAWAGRTGIVLLLANDLFGQLQTVARYYG